MIRLPIDFDGLEHTVPVSLSDLAVVLASTTRAVAHLAGEAERANSDVLATAAVDLLLAQRVLHAAFMERYVDELETHVTQRRLDAVP